MPKNTYLCRNIPNQNIVILWEEKNKIDQQLSLFLDYYQNQKRKRTREIMEMFLFAFHSCGLRVSDIITLQWKQIDFEEGKIYKRLVKNGRINPITLTDSAFKILKKWQSYCYNKRFVFNLLPEYFDVDDAAAFYKEGHYFYSPNHDNSPNSWFIRFCSSNIRRVNSTDRVSARSVRCVADN